MFDHYARFQESIFWNAFLMVLPYVIAGLGTILCRKPGELIINRKEIVFLYGKRRIPLEQIATMIIRETDPSKKRNFFGDYRAVLSYKNNRKSITIARFHFIEDAEDLALYFNREVGL